MTEYGIWTENDRGFIETQLYSIEEAEDRLAELIGEAGTAEEAQELREDLQIVKVCPDHLDAPRSGCSKCEEYYMREQDYYERQRYIRDTIIRYNDLMDRLEAIGIKPKFRYPLGATYVVPVTDVVLTMEAVEKLVLFAEFVEEFRSRDAYSRYEEDTAVLAGMLLEKLDEKLGKSE